MGNLINHCISFERRNAVPDKESDEGLFIGYSRDGTPVYLNDHLIQSQQISDEDIEEIIKLHRIRYSIEEEMSSLDPVKDGNDLRILFRDWMTNEYNLQKAWNFPSNSYYYRDYTVPHCTCPVLDNDDRLGTDERIVTEGCIYHSKKE